MAKAEGRLEPFLGEDAIRTDLLEAIELPVHHRIRLAGLQMITEEWSSVCPYSGLPDYGRLLVEIVPTDKVVELKSLKYYLQSFRRVGIYQEAAALRVCADLAALLAPERLKVSLTYNIRGGIHVTAEAEYPS